jgi:hypothetical protein
MESQWKIEIHTKNDTDIGKAFIHIYDHVQDTEIEIDVDVEFDYQPPEKMTLEYPGCDEELMLTGVTAFFGEINIDEISNVHAFTKDCLSNKQRGEYDA